MATSRPAPPPPAPAPPPEAVVAALSKIGALRADLDAWLAAGKALMDRMTDLVHDSKRR